MDIFLSSVPVEHLLLWLQCRVRGSPSTSPALLLQVDLTFQWFLVSISWRSSVCRLVPAHIIQTIKLQAYEMLND